jgi:transketolase
MCSDALVLFGASRDLAHKKLFPALQALVKRGRLDVPAQAGHRGGATLGWYKYVGERGAVIGLDRFGASAPGEVVMEKLGFDVEHVVQRALELAGTSRSERR